MYAVEPEPQRPRSKPGARRAPRKPTVDYRNFSHPTHVTGQKLACGSCHTFPSKNWKDVRKGESAFPDLTEYPDHSTCLNCHRQQFFARERPAPAICSNCHVNVTPRDTARFLFPSLGDVTTSSSAKRDQESEFAVHFPHEVHLEVITASRTTGRDSARAFVKTSFSFQTKPPPSNCSVCHETYQPQGNSSEEYVTKPPNNLGDAFWLKKGTFKTIPNSHTGCFTCHNADSGIAPTSADCQVCHKLQAVAAQVNRDFDSKLLNAMGISDPVITKAWHRRLSAGAYRHEGGAHPDLACADCHRPSVMNTVDEQTLRIPIRSCGGAEGCHITATLDEGGSLNYEIDEKKKSFTFVCTKCHITFGRQTLPQDHLQAIPTPSPAKKPEFMGW